jgi:hypothetical protein
MADDASLPREVVCDALEGGDDDMASSRASVSSWLLVAAEDGEEEAVLRRSVSEGDVFDEEEASPPNEVLSFGIGSASTCASENLSPGKIVITFATCSNC